MHVYQDSNFAIFYFLWCKFYMVGFPIKNMLYHDYTLKTIRSDAKQEWSSHSCPVYALCHPGAHFYGYEDRTLGHSRYWEVGSGLPLVRIWGCRGREMCSGLGECGLPSTIWRPWHPQSTANGVRVTPSLAVARQGGLRQDLVGVFFSGPIGRHRLSLKRRWQSRLVTVREPCFGRIVGSVGALSFS
jgi:hypothetical protein